MSKCQGELLWESLITETNSRELRLRIKTTEAGRIFNVLDSAVRNMESLTILGYLRENRTNFDGNTIPIELKEVLASYMALHKSLSEAWGNQGEQIFENMLENIHEEILMILKKCRDINWRGPTLLYGGLTTDRTGNIHSMNLFRLIWRSYISEMMDELEFNPEEYVQNQLNKKLHCEQLEINLEMAQRVKDEGKTTETVKGAEIAEREKILNELRFKISLIDQFYKDLTDRQDNMTENEIQEMMEEHEIEMAKAEGVKNNIVSDFEKLKQSHLKIETELRHKKLKIHLDIESTIGSYDKDMWDKHIHFETLTNEYATETKQREELEKQIGARNKEYSLMVSEGKFKEQRENEAKDKLEDKNKAACVVQSWWRGCFYRLKMGLLKFPKEKKSKKGKKK